MVDLPLKDTNIPQLSYDIIARILPGFLILGIMVFCTTSFALVSEAAGEQVIKSTKLLLFGVSKIEIGFFDTIAFLIASYLCGWIFYKPDTQERKNAREGVKANLKPGEPSLREMYHYLRTYNTAAGQRLVKLRAEVRMWEALRNARVWAVSISWVLVALTWFISQALPSGQSLENLEEANYFWMGLKAVFPLVVFSLSKLRKEYVEKLWIKYWDDILLHYRMMMSNEFS